MPGAYLWGWDATNEVWVKVQVNADGKLIIDPSEIFEDPPTEDETAKGAQSAWCYDHWKDASAHHVKYTDEEAQAVADARISDHAALPTVHQDAPALIADHAALPISSAVHPNTHRAKVTMAADQYAKGDPTAFWSKLALDTESYDPGSNFDVSTFYTGTCTAGTNATTLVDSEANFLDDTEIVPFAGGGTKVSWDDGASYGYVTSRDSATQLTIAKMAGNDLAVDDVYTIKHAKYVAPVAGYYHISAVVFYRYTGLLADKVYMARLTVNGAEVASSASHSAVASQNLSCAISEPVHLDADDRVELFGWHVAAVDTIILRSGTSYSRFMIELIAED